MTSSTPNTDLKVVALDLYRNAHKGIRSELFAVTEEAGRLDSGQPGDRAALASHVQSVFEFLDIHAEHEDVHVQPALEKHLPTYAAKIASDHEAFDARLRRISERADAAVESGAASKRWEVHGLYLDLASFTAAYLEHQDLEERKVMPALEEAIGVDAVAEIEGAIVSSASPERVMQVLTLLLPAMNIDDRSELLGIIRETVPAEGFDGVWSLAGSLLTPADFASLASRLGIS